MPSRIAPALVCTILLAALVACGKTPEPAEPATDAAAVPASIPPYPISAQGGTPATGPGERYNACERIWCLEHKENFFIDHYATGHRGWVLHDAQYGDVFSPQFRDEGPPFRNASRAMLRLCGQHAHPTMLASSGIVPLKHTGYSVSLGYSRQHFNAWGMRLEPCCVNGLGHGFIHSRAGRQFNFHELDYYRDNPEWGWQKPFPVRTASAVAEP